MINCPGYGARALCKDETVVPVRGQIGWLIPQPEVNYGLYYDGVSVLSRRDGIVVQVLEGGDMRGYDDTNETPDRAESEDAVNRIAALYAAIEGPRVVARAGIAAIREKSTRQTTRIVELARERGWRVHAAPIRATARAEL